ncbi:MAG: hypothetical protein ACT6RZ_08875 [Methylophilus sp.]|uniref:hypothetical protein n=1 Tax=Methylophilus sp. TaxID=29541 RepID=UPI004035C07A
MEFSIQINVGQTPQEALESILEDFHKHEQGEKYVANQLGVLNWDEFYALFSPKGLMLVDSFVKSHNGIWPELILDCQPLVTSDQNSNISVSKLKEFDAAENIKNAADVMEYLRLTIEENDPVALADALKMKLRTDGINK